MDNASTDTAVQPEAQVEPGTDTATSVETEKSVTADNKSDKSTTPAIEQRDGKLFVDGVRVYTRDDTNKIAANARHEVEKNILNDLNVDSIDQVKQVVTTLQETNVAEGQSLNVESLRDAVKKREATVEELKAQVTSLKTDLLLKDHMSQLQSAMPSAWTPTQRDSVIKLMKADGMLAVEGDTFAIRNGNDFLTVDGETPDYSGAVELKAKELGLSLGKKGVDIQYGETTGTNKASVDANAPVSDDKLNSDAEYRAAYMKIRQYQPSLGKGNVSDKMVKDMLKKMKG